MADEFELRKSFYLNNIHTGIDSLMKYAPDWFGDTIPAEFQNAVKSLMNLSVIYYEQSKDFTDFAIDKEYEAVDPVLLMKAIAADLKNLAPNVQFDVIGESHNIIFTSSRILKDSLLNSVLCFLQFGQDGTIITMSSSRMMSSIKIGIDIVNLSPETPEISRLLKLLYTYYDKGEYRFRIGMEIPVSDMKKIGGIVNLDSRNDNRDISMTISFPSYDFIKTVEDIRKRMAEEYIERRDGDIIISMDDPLIELILKEKFSDNGYSVKSYAPERLKFIPAESYKAMIVDYGRVESGFITEADFSGTMLSSKVTVICGGNCVLPDSNLSFHYIKMPFEVESIIDHIEK